MQMKTTISLRLAVALHRSLWSHKHWSAAFNDWGRTVSHNASCRSLMRLKPVVRIFPSERNKALIGRVPSWTLSFTLEQNNYNPNTPYCTSEVQTRCLHVNTHLDTSYHCERTLSTVPLRGSMTRSALSLQTVQIALPSLFQLTL